MVLTLQWREKDQRNKCSRCHLVVSVMGERNVNKNKDGRELGGAGLEMDWVAVPRMDGKGISRRELVIKDPKSVRWWARWEPRRGTFQEENKDLCKGTKGRTCPVSQGIRRKPLWAGVTEGVCEGRWGQRSGVQAGKTMPVLWSPHKSDCGHWRILDRRVTWFARH